MTKKTKLISIARDFSIDPGPRFRQQGRHSGQEFREDYIARHLKDGPVTVVLDGTRGFGSSFIDEAFGGLVRVEGYSPGDLRKLLTIISEEDETYGVEAWESIDQAHNPSKEKHA
ncbi:STAS-like domain-containing protein [Ancylobacter sp. VNQ12]|uniref:STAS-like domain-containing protein n=1 Tax=Ancylobacter sp. VNQ12 TaxID=3400920 RepID=UPI003BFE4612